MSREELVDGLKDDLTKVASFSGELAQSMRTKLGLLFNGMTGLVEDAETKALRKNQALEEAHVEIASQRSINDQEAVFKVHNVIRKASQVDISNYEVQKKWQDLFYKNNEQSTPAIQKKQLSLRHKILKARDKAQEALKELPGLVIEEMVVMKIAEGREKKLRQNERHKSEMMRIKKKEQKLKAQRQKLALEQKMNALHFHDASDALPFHDASDALPFHDASDGMATVELIPSGDDDDDLEFNHLSI